MSSVKIGPNQSDVELAENDRSDTDDRNLSPSSKPTLAPRAIGICPLAPSTRSPNDLMSSGSRRSDSAGRVLRLLAVSSAPKSSTLR